MNELIPQIYIIVLNWNGKEDTIECLESVQKIDYPNYKILLVDNGSIDDSVAAIRERFPQVSIIENGANLGFAAGNNVGIDYAISQGADYIFLLNNDTIVDPQILWAFIRANKQYPDAGILGSKIYYYKQPQKIWYAGVEWIPSQARFLHLGCGNIDNDKDWREFQFPEYICGCAILVKAEVVKKIGMLEPKYFLMWEEVDWCYRAKRAGYKCLLVPESKVWHKISSSFSGGDKAPHYQYFWWRNRLLWVERNFSFLEAFSIYKAIFRDTLRQIRKYFNSQSGSQEKLKSQAALEGVKDYFLRKFGNCPEWVRSPIKQ
ncbi:glycosyltransferase family 2 protein [Nostoc ellipsosporum NOK]|nr:glycosyltransferase family 2 protein [Nostoc ellipsosporum NOK]